MKPIQNLRTAAGLGLVALLAILLPLAPEPAQAADVPPASAFFSTSAMRGPKLSPSGRWLAVLTRLPQRRVGVTVLDLEGREAQRVIEASTSSDFSWIEWVNDDWLVFKVVDPERVGSDMRGSGLMSMRRDGSESRMLIQRQWQYDDPIRRRRVLTPDHGYVGLGAPGSNEVIVEQWKFDTQREYSHSLWLALDVSTGATRSLIDDAPRAQQALLDSRGRARVLSDSREGRTVLYWSPNGSAPWTKFSEGPSLGRDAVPMYVQDDNMLVVSTEHGGKGALYRMDPKTGTRDSEPILTVPGFSSEARPLQDRGSPKVLGVQLMADTAVQLWFDPAMASLQQKVDAKLQGRVNLLSCEPCEKAKVVLITSYSDVQPTEYILYRPAEDRWQLLGATRPDIDASAMAPMSFHRIKARDGEDLPIWITRPRSSASKAAPAVVLVHGGPYTRGTDWGWEAESQFLASRGYVVIEPEFRGSTGYGYAHFKAGWKQWGLAMQDDLSDAMRFAVQQGWVDASRVCIVGASYGGYAALMGLVKDPDQYRCGVAFAAVTDIRNIVDMHWSDISADYVSFGVPVLLGDRKADAERFAATSPVVQAARIKAPVLLVHGALDHRVPVQNGEAMRDALQKAGKRVEWVLYPDEGHGFGNPANRIAHWQRVERFLESNLKE